MSLYIYYSGNQNVLIEESLYPLVVQLKKKRVLHEFFFIRYFENGPHIRFRLNVIDSHYENVLHFCIETINAFLSTDTSSNLDWNNSWRPKNTIEEVMYLPEFERYGGQHVINIAELQFMASSKAVIRYLLNNKPSYYDCLIEAMKLHIILGAALYRYDLKTTISYFELLYSNWNTLSYNKDYYNKVCLDYYNNRRIEINAVIKSVWTIIANKGLSPNRLFNKWNLDATEVLKLYSEANNKRQLTIALPNIVASFIHMTNNRLGIANIDENLINYFIKEGLSSYET